MLQYGTVRQISAKNKQTDGRAGPQLVTNVAMQFANEHQRLVYILIIILCISSSLFVGKYCFFKSENCIFRCITHLRPEFQNGDSE